MDTASIFLKGPQYIRPMCHKGEAFTGDLEAAVGHNTHRKGQDITQCLLLFIERSFSINCDLVNSAIIFKEICLEFITRKLPDVTCSAEYHI